MDVGIRELKQRLSEYLDRAARGEVIRITDRGRPKALLTGIREEQAVARGISEGWLSPGEDVEPAPIQRVRARKRVLELLPGSRPSPAPLILEHQHHLVSGPRPRPKRGDAPSVGVIVADQQIENYRIQQGLQVQERTA